MKTTFERLQDCIVDLFAFDLVAIEPSTRFDEDLNLDSLDMVELLILSEEEFGTVEDEKVENLKTVGEAVAYLDTLNVRGAA